MKTLKPCPETSSEVARRPSAPAWLRLLVAAVMLCLVLSGQAADLIRSQAVLVEPVGAGTLAEARQGRFEPLRGVLNEGYSDRMHWLRIEVAPRPEGGPVKLRIRPSFLDEVRLFEPDPERPGSWITRYAGDRRDLDASDGGLNSLGFLVQPQSPSSVYYLSLRTSSTALLQVEALTPAEATRKDGVLALWTTFYVGVLIAIMAWGVQDYLRHRQGVAGLFVVYQSFNILYVLCLMGYAAAWVPQGWTGLSDGLTSLTVLLTPATAILFHQSLLRPYRPPRWLVRCLNGQALASVVLIVAYLAGAQRLALQLNAALVLLAGVTVTVMVFAAREEGTPRLVVVRAFYALLQCLVVVSVLPLLGGFPASEWMLLGTLTLTHGLVSAMLMYYLLVGRSRLLRQQLEHDRKEMIIAQIQLRRERDYAEAQSQFIDMLTHELKTPLSVALFNLGAIHQSGTAVDRIKRALCKIKAIVDRTHLSDLAEHKRLEPQLAMANVSELVYERIDACAAPERVQARVASPLETRTDARLLGVILSNLIDNALKYAPADGPVELSLQSETRGLVLRVANEVGVAGIPDPQRLFSRFYRSAGAQSMSGSGLGLYLSHSLAELLGGRLDCLSDENRVEFMLCLPA